MDGIKIGIPRALLYWKQPYFWKEFFESLGVEVALSPVTNREIVENSVRVADPETCFSTKIFLGHVIFLEGKVDYIFIPRLKSLKPNFECCPKFFGLPDVVKIITSSPILSPWIDLNKESLEKTASKLAKNFTKDSKKIDIALRNAFQKEAEWKENLQKEYFQKIQSSKKKIILISHPYNLYDDYVNLGIKQKIENLGGEVIFIDIVPFTDDETQLEFHWDFVRDIILQVKKIANEKVSGAIEISSFQCGCDAVLKEFVEKEFKEKKIPFLYLLIDEHTGEAGIRTRLEAFWDTL